MTPAPKRVPAQICIVATVAALGLLTAGLVVPALSTTSASPATGRANTYILCMNKRSSSYVPKVKPHRCAIFGVEGGPRGVDLKKIHWHNWGHRRAWAKAIECGFRLPCQHIRAHVRVRRLRVRCRRTVYSRLREHTKFGSHHPRPQGCPGPPAVF